MPNTKIKKFDWQIFLAVFCILLVICCATVCCVISNDDKCVARAEESIYDTWDVSGGFYTKKITSSSDLQSIVNYYFSFIPEIQEIKNGSYNIGRLRFSYVSTNNLIETVDLLMGVELVSISAMNYTVFTVKLYDASMENSINFVTIIIDGTDVVTGNYWQQYSTSNTADYYYYTLDGNFLNSFLSFASVTDFQQLNSFAFSTYSTASIRWLVSQTDTFDDIPLPPGGKEEELHAEINRLTGIIQEQRQEIQYYESLNLNQSQIPIFTIARCSPSTFEYNGVTYTSDTIERTSSGWDIYHSSYFNQELPENYGVGFSLFLVETLSNTKYDMSPLIQCWYNYTGATARLLGFSVGYRNQNGQIVKVGEFSSDLPAENEFFINAPTNELVFFREDSNLMEVDNDFSIVRYQYDTQSIYNDGYDAGIRFGMQLGRQEGYNQGVLDANDYSFFSLFTSVFDAPITAIVGKWGDSDGDGVYQREGGMLNFYIPGLDINFAPFLLSLFTIAIIVMIIRFVLARKS